MAMITSQRRGFGVQGDRSLVIAMSTSQRRGFAHGDCSVVTLALSGLLPAVPDAGDAVVDAGGDEDELQHQDHTGKHQGQHVGGGQTPVVHDGLQKPVPAVEQNVSGAQHQSQVT